MPSQSNPDAKSRLEALRRNLSDATNPRIVSRSPALGAPRVVSQIRAEIKRLEAEIKGSGPRAPATSPGGVRVDGAYDFPLGTVLEGQGGQPWIFAGWGRNTAGLLPIFVRSMQNAYPNSQSVHMECPVTEDTLLKRFPGAVVHRIPTNSAPSRTAKRGASVSRDLQDSERVRLDEAYSFVEGDTIVDNRNRIYSFVEWCKNRAGAVPIFHHKHESGAVWEAKSAFEDTLLKRFPGAVQYRRKD